jgi:outer membrane protein assembly factor BamB
VEARTGRRLWKRHFDEGAPTNLAPAGGVIYTGIDSGIVHALDSTSGQTRWSYDISEGSKDELVSVVPTPSALFLASLSGALVALKA